MNQHIYPFTKFINEEFKEPLAPTHAELETLASFERLCKVGKFISNSNLPEWVTPPRMYSDGNRKLAIPSSWEYGMLELGAQWFFYPDSGTLLDSNGSTAMRGIDYSTERGWNRAVDHCIERCIVKILMEETVGESTWSGFSHTVSQGELDKIFSMINVSIGDTYDIDRVRRLLELVYQPISDGEMIRALAGGSVLLKRINRPN
jgi:hypothetical protein